MIRSLGVMILLFVVTSVLADTSPEPLLIRISSVVAPPAVEPVLRSKSSSPFYQYCETVVLDTEYVAEALRRLSSDNSLLLETPVTVELPNGSSATFFGEAGGTSKLSEGISVHYRGGSGTESLSYFSIGVSPRGEINATLLIGVDQYTLGISNRLPTHFLCLEDRDSQLDW